MKSPSEIIARAKEVFTNAEKPPMSLRAGNAADEYAMQPGYDPELDNVTDEYVENFHWGIHHLDPISWKYYLPHLIDYTFRMLKKGGTPGCDTFLFSLRPPDRDPPRFGALSMEQRKVIVDFLNYLAFSDEAVLRDDAITALEEYWLPDPLFPDQPPLSEA